MNSVLTTFLNTSPEQAERLQALRLAFAEVCNAPPLWRRSGGAGTGLRCII